MQNKSTINCGFEFVDDIGSINLNFVAGCFLVGGRCSLWVLCGGLGAWFLNDSISCPKQLSLKITFIV